MTISRINLVVSHSIGAMLKKQFLIGFRRVCKQLFKYKIVNIDKGKVQAFFERRSYYDRFGDFTESTSQWYMSILNGSKLLISILDHKKELSVCDVGCGRGGLIEWLENQTIDYRYVGFDIDRIALLKCEKKYGLLNKKFLAQDVENITLNNDETFDLIFTINVLPYVEDLTDYIENIRKIVTPDKTYLFIIDPIPSFFWDISFGGFVINLRKPRKFISEFEKAGFQLEEFVQLNTTKIFDVYLMGINSLTIWRMPSKTY